MVLRNELFLLGKLLPDGRGKREEEEEEWEQEY
jgi:hypothetical protein